MQIFLFILIVLLIIGGSIAVIAFAAWLTFGLITRAIPEASFLEVFSFWYGVVMVIAIGANSSSLRKEK